MNATIKNNGRREDPWDAPAAQSRARQAFKRLVQHIKDANGFSKYDEVAEHLRWGGQSTISHVVNGRHKVGETALLKLIQSGYNPVDILPEHPISQLWQKARAGNTDELRVAEVSARYELTPELPELRLELGEIRAFIDEGHAPSTKRFPLVDSNRLAERTFVVRMPDEALNNVTTSPLIPPGYSVFMDPDAKPRVDEPVLAQTDEGELLIRAFENKNSIYATKSGHGGRITSFTLLAVAYYAVTDF